MANVLTRSWHRALWHASIVARRRCLGPAGAHHGYAGVRFRALHGRRPEAGAAGLPGGAALRRTASWPGSMAGSSHTSRACTAVQWPHEMASPANPHAADV